MVKGLGIGPEFKARMVLFYWGKIVGQDIARHGGHGQGFDEVQGSHKDH